MADQWFYAVNDERRGPVSRDRLPGMPQDGRLAPQALAEVEQARLGAASA